MSKQLLSLNVQWNSNDFVDTPTVLAIQFTDEQLHKILNHAKYCIHHGVMVHMPHADVEYFDDETQIADFKSDVHNVRITGNTCYFYAQSKYDSSIQIESEPFSVVLNNNEFSFDFEN